MASAGCRPSVSWAPSSRRPATSLRSSGLVGRPEGLWRRRHPRRLPPVRIAAVGVTPPSGRRPRGCLIVLGRCPPSTANGCADSRLLHLATGGGHGPRPPLLGHGHPVNVGAVLPGRVDDTWACCGQLIIPPDSEQVLAEQVRDRHRPSMTRLVGSENMLLLSQQGEMTLVYMFKNNLSLPF